MQASRRIDRGGGNAAGAAGVDVVQADKLRSGLGADRAGADGDGRLALHGHPLIAAQAVWHHIAHVDHLHPVGHIEVDMPADASGGAIARHDLDDHAQLVTHLQERGRRHPPWISHPVVQQLLRLRVEEHVDHAGLQVVRLSRRHINAGQGLWDHTQDECQNHGKVEGPRSQWTASSVRHKLRSPYLCNPEIKPKEERKAVP